MLKSKAQARNNGTAFTGIARVCFLLIVSTLTATATAQSRPLDGAAAGATDRGARIDAMVQRFHAAHCHDAHGHDEHIGTCISLGQFSVLFSPETTAADVESYLDGLPDDALGDEFEAFQTQGSIWTTTATDGAIAQGDAFTLTYSFVLDGTNIPSTSHGEAAADSNLFATINASFPGGMDAFRTHVRAVFDRLEEITNITYVEVADDGAAFPNSSGLLGSRGDVRICMKPFDGPGSILAVNFFPQFGGDMIMDSSDIALFANSASNFIRLRNLVAHEHGHGLGLRHVIPETGTKLMEPNLVTGIDGPQEDDVRGITFLYGDQYEPNDVLNAEYFLPGDTLNDPSTVGVQVIEAEEASLERSDSKDFYGFTAFANIPIAIRVEPVGTTYDQGAQGGVASPLDAKAVRNLGLRLWRRVSAQDGTFSLLAQIDFNQAGESEYHPPIPYQLAGYMVAEVYSADGVDDCQRYKLRISNAAIEPFSDPPSMSVFDVAAGQQVNDGQSVQFGTVQVGQSGNKTLTIVNGGPGDLEIGTISVQGPAAGDYSFTLIGSPTVPSGQTRSLAVAFTPTAAGQRVAVMEIPNNDPTQPDFSLILSGTATAMPVMQVRINGVLVGHNGNFDFGGVVVGSTETVTLQIQNAGNAQLDVTSVTVNGANATDFSSNLLNASIAPAGSVSGNLSFTPADEGPRSASLVIANNAAPYSADLEGDGFVDCNANGFPDDDDISDGTSEDCNGNGIPDECEDQADLAMDCLAVTVAGNNGVIWTLIPEFRTTLANVSAIEDVSVFDPVNGETPVGVELPAGAVTFEVHGVAPGGSTVVTIILGMPDGMAFNSFWKFGPEPDNATPHWYEFLFDGETGAVINDNVITLTLVDGGRGDHDGVANGVIVDPSAVAFVTNDAAPPPFPLTGCGACGVGTGMMVPLILIGLQFARSRRRTRPSRVKAAK